MNVLKYWETDSLAPPMDEIFGRYKVNCQLHEATNCSYIYLCSDIFNKEKKVLKFVKCKKDFIINVLNEIEIMSLVNHQNIIKLDEYFLYNEYMCIVMPFIESESLHSLIFNEYFDGIPEEMASKIMFQLLDAVHYLHKKNIWHRDIKTENILVVDPDQLNPKVELADFGFASRFNKGEKSNEFIGTPNFSAPEIFKQESYNEKVDIWSLGITLYVMLTGMLPFPSYSNRPRECRSLIINGLLNYQLLSDFGISDDAIDLIKKMCAVDPELRITSEEAMNHPWIVSQRSKSAVDNYSPESQVMCICK